MESAVPVVAIPASHKADVQSEPSKKSPWMGHTYSLCMGHTYSFLASETLIGLNNGNRRYIYVYIVRETSL